jgi:hypothetical protein
VPHRMTSGCLWWSLRVGRRGRVSKRGLIVGAGRLRLGASWPKAPRRPSDQGTSQRTTADLSGPNKEAELQEWLAAQPDDVKAAALDARLAEAEKELGLLETEDVMGLSDMQAEYALADEILAMKERDPGEWVRFLASLPKEDRIKRQEIEAKFDL